MVSINSLQFMGAFDSPRTLAAALRALSFLSPPSVALVFFLLAGFADLVFFALMFQLLWLNSSAIAGRGNRSRQSP
jgi:hypothetical protein